MADATTAQAPQTLQVRQEGSVHIVEIPDDMDFGALREWIRGQMPEHQAALGGRTARLHLGNRPIQLFDIRRLLHLFRDEYQVDITGLYVTGEAIHSYAERELKLKLFPLADEPVEETPEADAPEGDLALPGLAEALAVFEDDDEEDSEAPAELSPADDASEAATDEDAPAIATELGFDLELDEPRVALRRRPIPTPDIPEEDEGSDSEPKTMILKRTLRSGVSIKFDGNVHIFGDVNPGAQITAAGHVVVMGKLKGMVHAGAQGTDDAFILALELKPTQLRIGKQIAIAQPGSGGAIPEIAVLSGDQIVIEPYRGRIPR